MDLSVTEEKLTGVWARNCDTTQQVLILKICLRARKVSGSFEKRALGPNNARACYSGFVTDHQFNQ